MKSIDIDSAKNKSRKALQQLRDKALLAMGETADKSGAPFEFARSQYNDAVRDLKQLGGVERIKTPDIYSAESEHSFFLDMASQTAVLPFARVNPAQARERLIQHETVDVVKHVQKRANAGISQIRDLGGRFETASGQPVSKRAISDVSSGYGWSPPRWLENLWIEGTRAASVFAKMCPTVPLPDGVSSVILPQVLQSTDPYGSSELQQVVGGLTQTGYITCPVRSFSGITKLSQIVIDRGPAIDQILLNDSLSGYAEAVDFECVMGDGTGDSFGGELLGINSIVPTANLVTDSGTYSAVALINDLGNAAELVASNRRRPPTAVLLYTPRYFSMMGSNDAVGDSILLPGLGTDVKQSSDAFGPLINLPVYLCYGVGAAGSDVGYDAGFVVRFQDMLLFESPTPKFSYLVDGAGASTLTGIWEYHTYLASALHRFPYSIGKTSGVAWTYPVSAES
jgi:hypothetical protein